MTSTTSNATTRGQRILIALISNKEPTFPDTPPGHALLKYVTRVYEVAKYLLDCPETELSLCEAHMANKFVYEPTGVPTTAAKLTKIMADDNETHFNAKTAKQFNNIVPRFFLNWIKVTAKKPIDVTKVSKMMAKGKAPVYQIMNYLTGFYMMYGS